ncbi:MAG: hypothetical protein ACK42I_11010, partial [Thermomicrobium sp.]
GGGWGRVVVIDLVAGAPAGDPWRGPPRRTFVRLGWSGVTLAHAVRLLLVAIGAMAHAGQFDER